MAEEDDAAGELDQHQKHYIPLKEFLESYAANSVQLVTGYYAARNRGFGGDQYFRAAPLLKLWCSICKGYRNFDGKWVHCGTFTAMEAVEDFLKYTCRDCKQGQKTYSLISCAMDEEGLGQIVKVGEYPELHVDIPESLSTLLGQEYALFLRGLTCESRGLGIGAFTYYRRVVESQKTHFISEILRVAEKTGAPADLRDRLRGALTEKQFSRAVDLIKDAIPESVRVDSHNPLKVLHDALSIGVHAESDEKCLQIAHSIRIVLIDLSERLQAALAEHASLKVALSDLFRFKNETKSVQKSDGE
jgi:hypothetical protein